MAEQVDMQQGLKYMLSYLQIQGSGQETPAGKKISTCGAIAQLVLNTSPPRISDEQMTALLVTECILRRTAGKQLKEPNLTKVITESAQENLSLADRIADYLVATPVKGPGREK